MKKRLNGSCADHIAEIATVAFGLGILLAFFLSPRALALIESLIIISLGISRIRKG